MMSERAQRRSPTHLLSGDGERVPAAPRRLLVRLVLVLVALGCLGGIVSAIGLAAGLYWIDRTPREWAPYILKRSSGHWWGIEMTGRLVARWLTYADSLPMQQPFPLPARLGAAVDRSGVVPLGRVVTVGSSARLGDAIAAAQPGDVIRLAAGTYHHDGYAIPVRRPGSAAAPITLRADRLGDAVIESDAAMLFNVAAPFWHFENLVVRGACSGASDCEHAFHVVGGATDTVIRNNRLEDFNAAIKVNGESNLWPDRGLIEGNTLINTFARDTEKPITPIDMVGASGWVIRGNIIADFGRSYLGGATYGAFAKGAGADTVFERNLVICAWKLRGLPGPHVGLSLGGGGTDPGLLRDGGRTGFEQIGGIVRDNLIMNCNDDGIYLNEAARSLVTHNTLLDTAGIDARFTGTSATVTDNLVDGLVRVRDGAKLKGWDNDSAYVLGLFAGWHPQRGAFVDPAADMGWRRRPGRVADDGGAPDLCGQTGRDGRLIGAFEDYAACRTGP